MNKLFEELDYQPTSLGVVSLRRRRLSMQASEVVYEIKLDEAFLMSSMFHAVEDALADLGLQELGAGSWDVVVGGLGLGYTAVAALAHVSVRTLVVVEALEPVIKWHENGIVPLGPKLIGDPRCRLMKGDFFALAGSEAGFESGRKYHAVLLDIDHSPHNLLHPQHGSFYSLEGLHAFAKHLQPEGVFAMWSDGLPEAEFLQVLQRAFPQARSQIVTFPNPLLDRDSASTVYIARAE